PVDVPPVKPRFPVMMIRPLCGMLLTMAFALAGCSQGRVDESPPAPVTAVAPERGQVILTALAADAPAPPKGAWPLFGGTPARNMVNMVDKGIPAKWSVEDKDNIKWVADLGTKAFGGPVVANGKVIVGTNNKNPRDPSVKGNRSIVMCFQESD